MCCVLGRSGCAAALCGALALLMLWWHNRPVAEYYAPAPWWVRAELRALPRQFGPGGERVVLLTGMAGFVGYHTAQRLHEEGVALIGLDNFNHYYDPGLKTTRAADLRNHASKGGPFLRLFQGDVCDADLLKLLLREGRVTNVIHLAAQVRLPTLPLAHDNVAV